MERIQKIFFITLFGQKNPERKKIDFSFSLKRSLHRLRKINETVNPIFGLGHEYRSSSKKEPRNLKKIQVFLQKTEGVILEDGNLVGTKSSLYPCCSSQKRMVSESFISFEEYELRMRKKFHFFSYIFCPKKPSMKK